MPPLPVPTIRMSVGELALRPGRALAALALGGAVIVVTDGGVLGVLTRDRRVRRDVCLALALGSLGCQRRPVRGRGGRGAVAWDARPAARARRPWSDVAVGAAAVGEHGQAVGAQRSGAFGRGARAAADVAGDRAALDSCSEPVGQPASWSCAAARRRGPDGAPARRPVERDRLPLVAGGGCCCWLAAALAAVLLGALAVCRLWARRRRVYALYELHLSLQDEAPFGRVMAMVRQIGGTLRARPAGAAGWRAAVRRVGADRDRGPTEMRWRIGVRCEPRSVQAIEAHIRGCYPDVRARPRP